MKRKSMLDKTIDVLKLVKRDKYITHRTASEITGDKPGPSRHLLNMLADRGELVKGWKGDDGLILYYEPEYYFDYIAQPKLDIPEPEPEIIMIPEGSRETGQFPEVLIDFAPRGGNTDKQNKAYHKQQERKAQWDKMQRKIRGGLKAMSERTEAELREQAYKEEKGPSHPDVNVILPDEEGAMQPTVISSFSDTVAVIAVPVNQKQMDGLRGVQKIAGMLGNIEEGIPGAPPLHALMSSAFESKYEEMMIQLTTQLVDILTKTAGANHERNKE